jgi:hypothetical protein
MKSWLWKGMFAAVISLPALSGVARAQSTDNDGCTNATLKGDYAFSVVNFTQPSVGVGIKAFDGKGQFTQEDYHAIAFGPRARPVFERVRPAPTR